MKKLTTYLKKVIQIIIHALFKGFLNIIHAKFDWLKIINAISYKIIAVLYIILFIFGRILLHYNPIRFDIIHQVVLTIISIMSVFSLKYAYNMTNKLKQTSLGLIYNNRENNCTSKTIKMIVESVKKSL